MKQKIFFVLAALMMLTGTSAMAQSETLKGDVNGDGAVDVADIAAVIQIMKDNGDIETKYYWYVGQENPAELDETFDPETVKVTDKTSPGWRYVGTVVPVYSKLYQLWNGDDVIDFAEEKTIYLALPSSDIKYRNEITNGDVTESEFRISQKVINGVEYTIWESLRPNDYWGMPLY